MTVRRIPALARCATEDLANHHLGPNAITWSVDEFHVASDALFALLRLPEEQRPPSPELPPGEVDLFERAGWPPELRALALWFDERYRAHAPRIAWLHLYRFFAIWTFLGTHEGRLQREGLVTPGEEGMRIDEDLLTALVGVDYDPGFRGPPRKPCIGRYRDVLALARAVASGEVVVVEFVRKSPEGSEATETPGRGDECVSHGTEEELAVFEPVSFELDDFVDAMEVWYGLSGRPSSELRGEAALFRRRLGFEPEHPFASSPAVILLMKWFAERFEGARLTSQLFLRFMVMAGFIEQHLDRLVELGFLEPNGERHLLTGSLFSALNNLPLTPSDEGGAAPFDFDAVVTMASAHRELLGDQVMLRREAPPSPSRPGLADPVGSNDACPCGSGRRFKRCCWPMMN